MSKKHTIQECLAAIGVEASDLQDAATLVAQFSVIKKTYYKKILQVHPDKGGDAAVFREVQTSFEVLRDMYTKGKVDSFVTSASKVAESYERTFADFGDMPTPSWDYYYEAAEEEVPLYRVEPARSGRSRCAKCKSTKNTKKYKADPYPIDEVIAKDSVRIGSLDSDTGSYGRWNHLACWRVPSRVWLGLPNPESCSDTLKFEHALLGMNEMLFCGLNELGEEDKAAVIAHVMNKEHWARLVKRRAPPKENTNTALMEQKEKAKAKAVVPTGYHAPREVFVAPFPGKNGVQENALAGKRVVLTGVFPEVGGGRGLNLGKDKVKKMVENLGGRVTSSVSGKTDILIVGKEPGYSKVSSAREKNVELLTLKDWKDKLEGRRLEGETKPLVITDFSSGYRGNSLALEASSKDYAIAAGLAPARITNATKRAPSQEVDESPKKKPALNPAAKAFVPSGGLYAAIHGSAESNTKEAPKITTSNDRKTKPSVKPAPDEGEKKPAAKVVKKPVAKGQSKAKTKKDSVTEVDSSAVPIEDETKPAKATAKRRPLKRASKTQTDGSGAAKPALRRSKRRKENPEDGAENLLPPEKANAVPKKKKPAKKAALKKKKPAKKATAVKKSARTTRNSSCVAS